MVSKSAECVLELLDNPSNETGSIIIIDVLHKGDRFLLRKANKSGKSKYRRGSQRQILCNKCDEKNVWAN